MSVSRKLGASMLRTIAKFARRRAEIHCTRGKRAHDQHELLETAVQYDRAAKMVALARRCYRAAEALANGRDTWALAIFEGKAEGYRSQAEKDLPDVNAPGGEA